MTIEEIRAEIERLAQEGRNDWSESGVVLEGEMRKLLEKMDASPPHVRAKAPRTGEIIQDIKACLAGMDGVAAFVCVNTGVAGGWEIVLPTGGVARWEDDGVSFDFAGQTPQQIEMGRNQLANLLNRASQGLGALRGLCGAYQSAAKAHAKDNPVMLAQDIDLVALTKSMRPGKPN